MSNGWPTEVSQQLGRIFRHMLPGILVVGATKLAYPDWFCGVKLDDWTRIVVLGTVSLAVGNAWFALNRYGLHQLLDWVMYRRNIGGPARGENQSRYRKDLGEYVHKALHLPETSRRAWQHVEFRASAVLLVLTVGELLLLFGGLHACNSWFAPYRWRWIFLGLLVFAVGVWQMAITRTIDKQIVDRDYEEPTKVNVPV